MTQQSSSPQSSDWLEITDEYLQAQKENFHQLPEKRQQIRLNTYFNGCDPQWGVIQSGKIPEREIVTNVIESLNDIKYGEVISSILLHGATGEGKTTALMQVASQLSNPSENWKIYWRKSSLFPDRDGLSKLVKEMIQKKIDKTIEDNYFLFICDHAEQIFDDIYAAMMEVYKNQNELEYSNFCFLLCCRTTEWKTEEDQLNKKIKKKLDCQSIPNFIKSPIQIELKGLLKEDAEAIVTAWKAVEDKLKNQDIDSTIEEESQELFRAANPTLVVENDNRQSTLKRPQYDQNKLQYSAQYSSVGTGTFFGAILYVRFGLSKGRNYFIDRLRSLMDSLTNKPIILDNEPEESDILFKIFVYITAFETERKCVERENKQKPSTEYIPTILEQAPLAYYLGCDERKLEEFVQLLGEEIFPISTSNKLLFTRHPMIADIAFEIIKKLEFSQFFKTKSDIDDIYLGLLKATFDVFLQQDPNDYPKKVSNIKYWNFLSQYFFDKGNPEDKALGLELAKLAYQKRPDNIYLVTTYANIISKYNSRDGIFNAINFLRSHIISLKAVDGAFYSLWGEKEGQNKNYELDVWLQAISLADWSLESLNNQEERNKRIQESLKGLSIAFANFNISPESFLSKAACSALYLRKKLPYRKAQLNNLERNLKKANFQPTSKKEALELIYTGVEKVWGEAQKQVGKAIDHILNLDYLKFDKLGEYFGVYTSSSATKQKKQDYHQKISSQVTQDMVLSRPSKPQTTQKETKPMPQKPKVFIGSFDSKSFAIANTLFQIFSEEQSLTPILRKDDPDWRDTELNPNPGEMYSASQRYSFAIFVFAFNDIIEISESKTQTKSVVSDDMIFEIGLFCGVLNPDRICIIIPEGYESSVPHGISRIRQMKYQGSEQSDLRATYNQIIPRIKRFYPTI